MKAVFKYILIFLIQIIAISGAMAQKSQTISGKVYDEDTGELLPGATIQLLDSPENAATITDLNGRFSLKEQVISGQKLRITFIGYQTYEYELGTATTNLKIQLKPTRQEIEEVEITAYTEGQTKALLEQKNAVNIKNVVSSEQIEEFPDMNAAETLQRIPGITLQRDKGEGRYVQLRGTPPEYTNFNINGEQIPSPEGGVRYVGLDVISSDQIEFIEVSKVLTPDMDADAIGGNVNIITKSAKSEEPEISASASGGYSDLRESPNYQGQFSFAQKSNKIGFTVNANYYKNIYGADNMEFEYMRGPFWGQSSQEEGVNNYHLHYSEAQLRHYDITRERIGISSTLDYEFNENSKVYIRGMYNNFSDYEVRRRIIYTVDDPINEYIYLYGGIERDLKEREKIQNISSVNIGGEQKTNFIELDYELAYSSASENVPDRIEIAFDNPGQAIFMEFDVSDPDYPQVSFPDSNNAVNATNYAEYELEELRLQKSLVTDKNITGKVNFKVPYITSFGNGFFKFGGKTRHKTKERDIQAQIYTRYDWDTPYDIHTGTGPEFLLPELYDGFVEDNLLNKGYTVDWVPSPEKTREFYEFYPQHFYLNKNETKENTFTEDYLAHEQIYAGYGMIQHRIYDFVFIGGMRYEHTHIDYKGKQTVRDRRGNFQSLEDTVAGKSHSFLLPQMQIKYAINNTANLKFAVTKTFSRPNFEDLIPYKNEERDKIKLGNADLKFPQAINIDLLAEKYGKNGSLFSGGLFYKNIDDYIYYHRGFVRKGDTRYGNFPRIRIEVPKNGKKAHVYGAELTSQFKFSFLPWIFKDLGLYVNYSYTYSEAFIPQRKRDNEKTVIPILTPTYISDLDTLPGEEKINLPGQAEHTGNFALFYDSGKLYLKLSANYTSDFIVSLGSDAGMDEYYAAALHLDFNANYSITENLKIFTDFKNLTNAPLKYYLGPPENNRILKQEYYSWWFRVGVRLKIN